MLRVGSALVPIDHASALPVHHGWRVDEPGVVADLGPPPGHLYEARSARLRAPRRFARREIEEATADTPEPWLGPLVFGDAARQRAAYAAWLWKRLQHLG